NLIQPGGVSKAQVIGVVLFAVLCVSAGETLLAAGMKQVAKGNYPPLQFVVAAASNRYVVLGTVLMMAFFALYSLALSWADFSFVLPLTALSFLLGAVFAQVFLHENVTPTRWIGTLIITVGVIVVGLGHKG